MKANENYYRERNFKHRKKNSKIGDRFNNYKNTVKNWDKEKKKKVAIYSAVCLVGVITLGTVLSISIASGGSIDDIIRYAEENIDDEKTKEKIVKELHKLKELILDEDIDEIDEKIDKIIKEIKKANDKDKISDISMNTMIDMLERLR